MLAVLFSAAVQAPQVIVREPLAATPWTQTFAASCGRQRLEVIQHLRPLGRAAEVKLNGRAVLGDSSKLIASLSEPRAAYRMSLQCSQGSNGMWFRWVRGMANDDGKVGYAVGSAIFHDGRIVEVRSNDAVSGPDQVNADSFWFR